MVAKLHLIKGNPQGKQVEVPAGTLTVGRAEDSDLIIASTRVSRHHCEIVNDGNQLIIRDKGSANGTLVNGVKIQQQTLAAGDEVQIGPLTFVVEIDGVRTRPPKPVAQPKPQVPPKPIATKPAAAALPKVASHKPPLPAKGAPQKAKFPTPPGKPAPDDILASLERLAGGKKKDAAKKGDVLEISDEDLLDRDK